MATLINNAGVQHYANKMVLAENRKVGSKSLPTALNDIDLALDEMENLFDAEYGSALDMKLENTENIFSVGAGSGVDKRDEVENSFTDVELKGNTLVNLFGGGFTYTSSIIKYLNGVEVSPNATARFDYASQLKKDVKYTAIVKVEQVSEKFSIRFHTANTSGIFTQIASSNMSSADVQVSTAGIYKVLFTPQMDSIMRPFVWNTSESTINLKVAYILILEGDWTNKTTPDYFEGIKSVGELEGNKIEVSSVGKNLFDGVVSSEYSNPNINFNVSSDGVLSATNKTLDDRAWSYDRTQYRMKLKKGNYTITLETITPSTSQHSQTIIYKKGATDSLCMFGRSTMDRVGVNSQQISLNEDADIGIESKMFDGTFRIQIEKGSQSTTFTPYKVDKKQILLNEPLRGVGDVKDTIEKVNGEWKIIRRTAMFTFTGEERWNTPISGNVVDGSTMIFSIPHLVDGIDNVSINAISDRFPSYNANEIWIKDIEGVSLNVSGDVHLRISSSKLSEVTPNGFKEWLSKNNTKVIYVLATPMIEDISPITLQAWKNGTISIDSIISVESTHTVALNKPAQIKRNIEELTQLRNKVKSLEDQYDQIALEQAHQLELINHSFELDYI